MIMAKKKSGYGVLASESDRREHIADFQQEIESRLVLPHPTISQGVLTLVTRLGSDGRYEFLVEDNSRQAHIKCLGNLFDDTGTARPEEEAGR